MIDLFDLRGHGLNYSDEQIAAAQAEIDSLASRLDSAVEGNRSATQAQRAELADNGRRAAVERALGLQEQLSVVTIERDAADEGLTELRIELQEQQSRLDSLQNEHDSLKHDHERLFARDTANLNRLIVCQGRLGKLQKDADVVVGYLRTLQLEDGKEKVWVRPVVEARDALIRSVELSRDPAPSAPSEGEKPSLRCGAIANDLVGQCIFADGHSGEHRYGS